MEPSKSRSEYDESRKNPVSLAEGWKDLCVKERRIALEWDETWGAVLDCGTQDAPMDEKSLPKNLSVYSEFVPNTSNQVYGSRQIMPHGKQMIKQDGLPLFHGSYRGKKKTVEKEPS
ncbi:uncharacterized protein C2orf50 homolog [Gambusia affinis]|uniref:uncharacterized protein C2orf50 homolog n=1 Tax=Gambusia affinis TaxID=33528 RepID=UPI001CDD2FF0|nr:uncharacterized protein C2orf50 homolog [Gambusia affinis]